MSRELKTSIIAILLVCTWVLLLRTNNESTPSLRAKRHQTKPVAAPSSLANPVGWFTIKYISQELKGFFLNNSLPLNGQVVQYGNISFPIKSNFLFRLASVGKPNDIFERQKYWIRVQSQPSDNDSQNSLYALKIQNGRLVVGKVNESPENFEWNLIKDPNSVGFFLYNVKGKRCVHLNTDDSIIIKACSTKSYNQSFY